MYRLALSLDKLRAQVDAKYPARDKSSDGWIGDASHKSRESDHNAWFHDKKGNGVVSAIDIDSDLSATETVKVIAEKLLVSRDKRIKYLIYNGRITQRNKQGIIYRWVPYHGANAHKKHLHISVKSDWDKFDDNSDWSI